MLNFTLYDAIGIADSDARAKTILINLSGMPVRARLYDVAHAAGTARTLPMSISVAQAEEIARVLNIAALRCGVPAPDLLAVCTWKSLADAVDAHRSPVGGWEIRAVHAAIRRWRHTNALWEVIYAVDDTLRLPAAA